MSIRCAHRCGSLLLVLCFLAGSSALPARAQQPSPAPPAKLSGQYMPDDALAAVFLFPAKAIAAPGTQMMPVEIVRAWSVENFKIDLTEVASVNLVVGVPSPEGVEYGVVVSTTADFDITRFNQDMFEGPPTEIDGYQCYVMKSGPVLYVHQRDPRTLIAATPGFLAPMIAADAASGPLATFVQEIPQVSPLMAAMAMEPVRDELNQLGAEAGGQLPPPLQKLINVPNLVEGAALAGGLTLHDHLRLLIVASDPDAAQELKQTLDEALTFGRDMAVGYLINQPHLGSGPIADATRAYIIRMGHVVAAMLQPRVEGSRVLVTVDAQELQGLASSGMMVGLLLPAVQAARDATVRVSSANNIRQILLAMHNHYDMRKTLPANIRRDGDGPPLLSWRVAVLPLIERADLFQQFHLDEPWDSEHNIQLLDQMPEIFNNPRVPTDPGMTIYQVPVGEHLAFPADRALAFRDVTDGLSNTVGLLEVDAAQAVPWTKPSDAEIDLDDPLAKVSKAHPSGFNVGMLDGSVRFIPADIGAELFRALLTRDGGERAEVP